MTRYSTKPTAKPTAPIKTTGRSGFTYEGDKAFTRDIQSELFILGVNFMGEDDNLFYETGDQRQQRFVGLVSANVAFDPEWVQEYARFLRKDAGMRTASIVVLAEYIANKGPNGRELIRNVLNRADEPAELIGYWLHKYGKPLPMALRRGIADWLDANLTEYNAMKYAGKGNGVSLADAINLTHPSPSTSATSALFGYVLAESYGNEVDEYLSYLPQIQSWKNLQEIPEGNRRQWLTPELLKESGMTWERLSSWIPGGFDARAWEAMIPSMPFAALLRNLRNFEAAGISKEAQAYVTSVLTNPTAIEKSMMFPFRFYLAMKNTNSHMFTSALSTALDLSVRNVPAGMDDTLILVDTSGSMHTPLSRNSKLQLHEAGALFGAALATKGTGDLVVFGTNSQAIDVPKGSSIDKIVRKVMNTDVGWGTNTWEAIRKHVKPRHKRIAIMTDMQSTHFSRSAGEDKIKGKNVYNFNLAGYAKTNMEVGKNGVYEIGGLSDVTFKQIPLLEAGKSAAWPWLIK